MARALAVFIERQGVQLPVSIEPVLIAAEPGLHIDSVGSSVRYYDRWYQTICTAWLQKSGPEAVHEFTECILNLHQEKNLLATGTGPRAGSRKSLRNRKSPGTCDLQCLRERNRSTPQILTLQ
jgi:hypothetical protein